MKASRHLLRRATAVVLAMSIGFPPVTVAQQAPSGVTAAPQPGPSMAPPSPASPPAVPADSFLLRFGGIRPDACAGVNVGLDIVTTQVAA